MLDIKLLLIAISIISVFIVENSYSSTSNGDPNCLFINCGPIMFTYISPNATEQISVNDLKNMSDVFVTNVIDMLNQNLDKININANVSSNINNFEDGQKITDCKIIDKFELCTGISNNIEFK